MIAKQWRNMKNHHALSGPWPYQDTWGPGFAEVDLKRNSGLGGREGGGWGACWERVEWERMNGIGEETAGRLFRENLPFRWKCISQPGPGSGEANMTGFGLETWWSTVPEDDGGKMGCVEENNGQKKRARGCLCGRRLVAEAVVTSFAIRTGTNPLVLIWLWDSAWPHWKCW